MPASYDYYARDRKNAKPTQEQHQMKPQISGSKKTNYVEVLEFDEDDRPVNSQYFSEGQKNKANHDTSGNNNNSALL